MIRCLHVLTCILGALPVGAATDLWDMPPLRYSDTASSDPVAKLAADSPAGEIPLPSGVTTPLDRLRFVLKTLEIPEESQMLVFSKTSKQNSLIHPGNPRCLFFNENAYVGYVPGGDIEVIVHDDFLGSVFYLVSAGSADNTLRAARDTSDCLSCHGTARTESVPGVLVRSVFPDSGGQPLLALGTFQVDHSTPIQERWGGYYVTGRSSLPHLGNRTFDDSPTRSMPETAIELSSVSEKTDTSRYLRATSDIVALMVLEHQCLVHNMLAAATVNYRRIHWLAKSLNPSADPDQGSAGRHADEAAKRIAAVMLFENEANLGENGVEGDASFQDAFTRRFPKNRDGRSLADFQLNDRLFKHRCSYMIHSKAFKAMPVRVRSAVLSELHRILNSPPSPGNHPHITASERRKIVTILGETVPGWPS